MSNLKRLISGSVVRNVEFFVMVAVTFVMSPVIIHSLGDRGYGFWTLIGTFLGYYGLLDFGLTSAVGRFISQAIGRDDTGEINVVASTSFTIFSILGLVSLVITSVVIAAGGFFVANAEELVLFRKITVIMGISFAIGFPMRVFSGVLSSYLRFESIALVSISRTVITNIFIYHYLSKGGGLLVLAQINFFGSIMQYLLTYLCCRHYCPTVKVSYRHFERSRVRSLFWYSIKTFVSQIADVLKFRVDAFVIAAYVNVGAVTYYSVGLRIIEYFISFMISCMGHLSPVFSQYEGVNDFDAIRKTFLNATKISCIISTYVGANIVLFGKPFIIRWMGPGYESSYYVMAILAVPVSIALMQQPGIALLYGISKHHFYSVANTCEGILNLILSLIFVRYYGMYGVALGTAVEMVLFKLFIQPVFTCRAVNIPLKDYYVDTLLVTTGKVMVPVLLFYGCVRNYLEPDYLILVGLSVLQTIIFIPFVYLCVFCKTDRTAINASLNFT